MTLEYILYTIIIFISFLAFKWLILSVRLQKRNEVLERQLTGNLTDFEKLEMIVNVYDKVNFNNINIDFLNDWYLIVQEMWFDIFRIRKNLKHESNPRT